MKQQIINLREQGYSHARIYKILGGKVSIQAIEDICINHAVAA